MTENAVYNIFSIRNYNNTELVFYNYTKRKRVKDVLSSYKTRYKRYLNNSDNWINVFFILKDDNAYIRIEEQIINCNDEMVKSRLCEFSANNKCINKMKIDDIEKLYNKPKNTENENFIEPSIVYEPDKNIEPDKIDKVENYDELDKNNEPYKNIEPDKSVEVETHIEPHKNIEPDKSVDVETHNEPYKNIEPDKCVEVETHIEPDKIIEPDKSVEIETHIELDKIIEPFKTDKLKTATKYSTNLFKEACREINNTKQNYNKTFKYNFNKRSNKLIHSKKTLKCQFIK